MAFFHLDNKIGVIFLYIVFNMAMNTLLYVGFFVLLLLIFTKFIEIEKHIVERSRTMEVRVLFEDTKNLTRFISELTSSDCNVDERGSM